MKYLVAILFLLTGLISEAQQRIVIENLAAVDSAWISGGNLFYRINGTTKNAGSVGGTAPVSSVFGRTGAVTAQSGDYSAFYPLLSGSYANPSWITSLPWSKITGTPTTLSGYGITDPVLLSSGSYSNPTWLTSLAWNKITDAPSFLTTNIYNANGTLTSNRFVDLGTTNTLSFGKSSITNFHLFNNGRVWIGNGTPIDAGYNLDVQGSLRVSQSFESSNRIVAKGNSISGLSGKAAFMSFEPSNFAYFGSYDFTNNLYFPVAFGANGEGVSIGQASGLGMPSNGSVRVRGSITLQTTAPGITVEAVSGSSNFSNFTFRSGGSDRFWLGYNPNLPGFQIFNQATNTRSLIAFNSTNNISIGSETDVPSAILQLSSTTKGFLPPRMTAAQASAISSPDEGLLVYVTNTNGTFTSKGWWGYNGSTWEKLNN